MAGLTIREVAMDREGTAAFWTARYAAGCQMAGHFARIPDDEGERPAIHRSR